MYSLINCLALARSKIKQQELRDRLMPNGEVAWEVLVDFWNEPMSN